MKRVNIALLLLMCFALALHGSLQTKALYFENGRQVSEQEFIDKGANGKKVLLDDGVKIGEIEMKEGQPHGKSAAWYRNGQKKCEKEYRCGKENGRWLEWDERGIKRSEINYADGVKQGIYTEWQPNGQKTTEGKYLQDMKEGRWLKWDPSGNLLCEEYWKENRLKRINDLVRHTEKTFIYYPGGQKKYARVCKGNKKHGKWIKWDVNGTKRYEREYKDGMKHGKWITRDGQGNIIGEEIWENGKMIEKTR